MVCSPGAGGQAKCQGINRERQHLRRRHRQVTVWDSRVAGARRLNMLAELVKYSERAALIDAQRHPVHGFRPDARSAQGAARRVHPEVEQEHACPPRISTSGTAPTSVPAIRRRRRRPDAKFGATVEESFKLLHRLLAAAPLPPRRRRARLQPGRPPGRAAASSPSPPGEDLHGHTHRLTLAFDTNVIEDVGGAGVPGADLADVQTGASFRLAHRAHEIDRFIELPWVVEWLARDLRRTGAAAAARGQRRRSGGGNARRTRRTSPTT